MATRIKTYGAQLKSEGAREGATESSKAISVHTVSTCTVGEAEAACREVTEGMPTPRPESCERSFSCCSLKYSLLLLVLLLVAGLRPRASPPSLCLLLSSLASSPAAVALVLVLVVDTCAPEGAYL